MASQLKATIILYPEIELIILTLYSFCPHLLERHPLHIERAMGTRVLRDIPLLINIAYTFIIMLSVPITARQLLSFYTRCLVTWCLLQTMSTTSAACTNYCIKMTLANSSLHYSTYIEVYLVQLKQLPQQLWP